MSAVPKKKLCWNCEGNISKEVDNCPYCGVYLHSLESEDEHLWSPSYRLSSADKEVIPTPPYQASHLDNTSEPTQEKPDETDCKSASSSQGIFTHLKKDVLSLLLLMSGSLFFLFGTILFLFSDQGTLTLQWKSDYWIYFFVLSLPALYFGWKFLQQLESPSSEEREI